MRRLACITAVSLAGLLVLNCDTSTPLPAFNLDAALPDTFIPPSEGGQQVSDAGPDGSPVVFGCQTVTDCSVLTTTPENCVTALDCIAGQCVYVAKDSDGDGHKIAGCKDTVSGAMFDGDDCDDVDPLVFPGAACTKDATGKAISFPGGTPQGTCKAGAITCASGTPACAGAVAPAAKDDCSTTTDENCDGVANDGCACNPTVDLPRDCGIAVGNCKTGKQTCVAGAWGACIGSTAPAARNCGAAKGEDFDCNGQADSAEAACLCGGKVAVGAKAKCDTGDLGICAAGTQTCAVDSKDSSFASFGACVPSTKAQAVNCTSKLDNNCDGVSDELEVGCGSPCLKNVGKAVVATPARQKFADNIYGCGGAVAWASRNSLCDGSKKFAAISPGLWVEYVNNVGLAASTPTAHYWTSQDIGWSGVGSANCSATTPGTGSSCGTEQPMRVCVDSTSGGVTDAYGNVCNWTNCGYNTTTNQHFGGCAGNLTAGTICRQ